MLFGQQEKQKAVKYVDRFREIEKGGTEMKGTASEMERPSYWQLIFMQSKVNGAPYTGETLPGPNWDWPRDTYLQRRLRRVKFYQPAESPKIN